MRQLDQIISQYAERIGKDDRCAETSTGYDKDSRRSKYNNYKSRGDNFEGKVLTIRP